MSEYDFIVDNIRYSYSSTNTFDTCAHSFRLAYIDSVPRKNNFYAEYGTLMHECFEKFFNGTLGIFELSQYYLDNYSSTVVSEPPPVPAGLGEKYKRQGLEFFDNFSFPLEEYDVLVVEDKVDFEIDGVLFVAKPDLVLKHKETQIISLFDYKTSTPFWIDKSGKEKRDKAKLDGYRKQIYLYCYAIREHRGIPVTELNLWFPRLNKIVNFPRVKKEEEDAISSIKEIVKRIKNEEIFPYNNTSPYFCENICGVRAFCEYR